MRAPPALRYIASPRVLADKKAFIQSWFQPCDASQQPKWGFLPASLTPVTLLLAPSATPYDLSGITLEYGCAIIGLGDDPSQVKVTGPLLPNTGDCHGGCRGVRLRN